ncbi:GDP-mannose 4,6-dehydratase [Salibacterium aidingense]|uniref:GDP-mannose 4,6-dehydratase n=1 Tax=Salibacterium aidingense TaxID=384933 RepID=UPI003BCAA0CB
MKRPAIADSNILIVGGAGFIGSHLADKLLEEGAKKVVILDNLFVGRQENLRSALDKGAILHVDDAENRDILHHTMKEYHIQIVFNCATKPLNYSFINPSNAFLTNVTVLSNLLELQRKKVFQTLCQFSSSEAYGSAVYQPMNEEHPFVPTTTYAAGKASADLLLQSYVNMFEVDAFIVRPFNNYGPRQNTVGPLAGVIPVTIKKILDGEAPEIHGSGQQTRDFIYVKDNVQVVVQLFSVLPSGESVNIASNQQLSVETVIKTIMQVMGYKGDVVKKPNRTADVDNHWACVKKLETFIGKQHRTDFAEGISSTVDWIRKHVSKEE